MSRRGHTDQPENVNPAPAGVSPDNLSTGNDLVCLSATRPERTGQPRFYFRILTADELALYHPGMLPGWSFDAFVWLCWSVKESVFKYRKRFQPELVFAPLRIVVTSV